MSQAENQCFCNTGQFCQRHQRYNASAICRCGTGHYCHEHFCYGLPDPEGPKFIELRPVSQADCGGGRRVIRNPVALHHS